MTANGPDADVLDGTAIAEFATELSASAEDALQTFANRQDYSVGDTQSKAAEQQLNLQTIMRIPVTMKVVVGSVTMPVAELKKLKKGDTVALDRRVGEAVDVVVNGQILARGMLVIVDGDSAKLGVSLKEIVELPLTNSEGGFPRKT
jgi:flagellar motor switch protein FliN/FliY